MKHLFILIVALGVMRGALADEQILFRDSMTGYSVGSTYTEVNQEVLPGSTGDIALKVSDKYSIWKAPSDKPFVVLQSSGNKYTFLKVTKESSHSYGQIFVRLGKGTRNKEWIRLLFSSNKQFDIEKSESLLEGAGADVLWDVNGFMRYVSTNMGQIITEKEYPTKEMHQVTINYDLPARRYQVWMNDELVGTNIHFSDKAFGTTIRAIGIGVSVWNGSQERSTVLDQWYWKVSDKDSFEECGVALESK